jgi:NDP-sugar pyrophosphorylase family protein
LGGEYVALNWGVVVHKSAQIAQSAQIFPPCIIGANSVIRASALIRGNVIVGNNCVIGNSTELKNCIISDGAKLPHFNYVGDSIVGYQAHFGAGAIASNVRADKGDILIKDGANIINTHLQKLGAFVGDYAEVGCNSVLNPGTVVGKRAIIYPLTSARGVVGEGCIYSGH